jgi:hypothetical protein
MRRLARLSWRILALLVLAALAIYVWPTRYRYDHVSVDGNTYPVRIDRFTGASDMLVPDQGWVPVEGDSGDESPGAIQPT